ncbi:MAG: FAD-dependent oxidoreductase [Candidatus Methanomethylicia archaeon]|nr:FAD-dependent oxidoreductase [Candidatus Methanomethylicia archaeon]
MRNINLSAIHPTVKTVGFLAECIVNDLIIVGCGPAGVSAAIYAKRKMLNVLVISKDIGGQVLLTGFIENYPGFDGVRGEALVQIFEKQLKELGVDVMIGEVEKIEKEGRVFKVTTSEGDFFSKTVIVTGGSTYKKLNVPGEERLIGRGVSFCATCDAPFSRNREVAVVGGGNAALQSAELLSRYAKKVYVIHRRDRFRADEVLVERVRKHQNIQFIMNSFVTEIKGEKRVEGITLKDRDGNLRDINVEMVFIEVGREVKVDYVKHLVKTNEWGQIVVDKKQRTTCDGLFAAGDITDAPYQQAIIAAGQGAVAALSAYDFLTEKGLLD